MLKIFLTSILFWNFLSYQLAVAENMEEATGTLIVTYQTGAYRERLDRVRFLLIDENNLTQLYPKSNAYVEDRFNATRMVVIENLKKGKYQIEFLIPNTDNFFDPPSSREVYIAPLKVAKINQVIKPRYASIRIITSVLPEGETFETTPLITLNNTPADFKIESLGGKLINHQLMPGSYLITFHDLPGYVAPEPIEITLEPNENLGPIEGIYNKIVDDNVEITTPDLSPEITTTLYDIQKTLFVEGGETIIGDTLGEFFNGDSTLPIVKVKPFYIGTFQVTNAQFAQWLNKAWREGKIVFHNQPEWRGHVTDKNNHLLFKTLESDSNSQIYTHTTSEGPHFLPMVGKHNFPVILVSWYGAQAYCQDNQFRLPTEAEWEKAAGMEINAPHKPLKKFYYGFGRDTIDKTWANYRYSNATAETLQVLTTRTGFYNGVNKLPKSPQNTEEIVTHKAQSPCGAYDMSGNVWEWVGDWYSDDYYKTMPKDNPQGPSKGIKKTAKGGCYDSLVEGVRVAERIALPPEHTDIYTGFRVAGDVE